MSDREERLTSIDEACDTIANGAHAWSNVGSNGDHGARKIAACDSADASGVYSNFPCPIISHAISEDKANDIK